MNIGNAIQTIRLKRALPIKWLALMSGIELEVLERIESGNKKPSKNELKKLTLFLEVEEAFIQLLALEPEKDMTPENAKRFNNLFPDLREKLESFIKEEK